MYWILSLLIFLIIGFISGMDLIEDFISRNAAITSNIDNGDMTTLFPSLTLCPHDILDQTKVNEFKRENMRYILNNQTPFKESHNVNAFLQNLSKTTVKTTYHYLPINIIAQEDYMQLVFNLSRNYDITVADTSVVKIMTEVGICYTINNVLSKTLYTKYWRDLNPYPENFTNSFEVKIQTFNFSTRFPFSLDLKHNITGNITVYVHSPYEIPSVWTRPALVIDDRKNIYTIKAIVQEITINNKKFFGETTVENRRCRNSNESNLKLFPFTYSRNLCLMECRAFYIRKLCDCVPHIYAQTNWKDINICSIEGLNCFNRFIDIFRTINSNTRSSILKCDHCQPNCIEQIVVSSIHRDDTSNNTSTILFQIEHPPFQSYIRSVMYTKLDYIGALSSFFGFTLYGFCDFIYFFTVRIYWFRKGFRGTVDDTFN